MSRSITLSIAALALAAGLAFAEPGIVVRYADGVPVIQLAGSYARSQYTVYRADAPDRDFAAITDAQVLCIGDCFAVDVSARPGLTYWYRFDLNLPDGRFVSYGPYPVTISPALAHPFAVAVYPNPGRGPTRVDLSLAGDAGEAPLDAEATLFDVQGRALKRLHRGPLARGVTTLQWDGRDREGREVGPGLYFIRLATPAGLTVARVIRVR